MKRVVPYGIRIGESGNIEVVPVVRARVKGDSGKVIPVVFLLDSGATTSLLSLTDAEALGIELTSGEKISLRGISGVALFGYRHTVALELEGFPLSVVPIVFSSRSDVPRVLGREGVFEHFGIFFDERKQRIGLLDRASEKTEIDRMFSKTEN